MRQKLDRNSGQGSVQWPEMERQWNNEIQSRISSRDIAEQILRKTSLKHASHLKAYFETIDIAKAMIDMQDAEPKIREMRSILKSISQHQT